MTNTKPTISEAEYEVMRVVWANNSVKSREIINVLTESMDWNESTVKTLIGRLVEKGALETEKEGRSFIYSAAISEQHTLRKNIDELISLLANRQADAPETITCKCTPGQCEHHLIH